MKATFKLEQHTPLIHFQHSHANATLRGSELKPRFDRFLQGKIDGALFAEKGNLDYKVKISVRRNSVDRIEDRHPLFFGNMAAEKRKEFVTSDVVHVTFLSFTQGVIDAVKKHFEAFLANTNFGTRQSKGFGSFYIKGASFDASLIEKNSPCSRVFKFTANDLYGDISLLYSMLRSGINKVNGNGVTEFYGKSLMFRYAKSKNITWDKKAIKSTFFAAESGAQITNHRGSDTLTCNLPDKYLMRDLLGLSSEQEWMRPYNAKIKKAHIKRAGPDAKEIDRFPSPIIFKPVKVNDRYDVYFWARPMGVDILNENFRISSTTNGGTEDMSLKTPPAFDIDDFLSFCFDPADGVDMCDHIRDENGFRAHNYFYRLNSIFDEIRSYQ